MWLIQHHFNTKFPEKKESPRTTDHFLRWRQQYPSNFIDNSFKTRTITPNIKLIIGKKK